MRSGPISCESRARAAERAFSSRTDSRAWTPYPQNRETQKGCRGDPHRPPLCSIAPASTSGTTGWPCASRMESPLMQRSMSSASARADSYRCPGSLCRHFIVIVSRSAGSNGLMRRSGFASWLPVGRRILVSLAASRPEQVHVRVPKRCGTRGRDRAAAPRCETPCWPGPRGPAGIAVALTLMRLAMTNNNNKQSTRQGALP